MSDAPQLHALFEGLEVDRAAPPAVLVIFGASGDLTARKLMPALQSLAARRRLPGTFAVVGVARTELDDDDFRARMRKAVEEASGDEAFDDQAWEMLAAGMRYVAGDYDDPATFVRLGEVLSELDSQRGTGGNRVYYLATVPNVFDPVVTALARHGLTTPGPGGFARVVVEKPFGHDLESARALDASLHAVLDESQIYRIDHYLGKETVQNLMALRFANTIFEPLWNRQYVDHVQITVAETGGVGHRAGFYEHAGALRDIVQNHLLQVMACTVMEPPASMDPRGIRDEKVKALAAIDVPTIAEVAEDVVRGQYRSGWADGEEVPAYRYEEGVAAGSRTETYVAARLHVDNWRWAGVPFFLRTGKRLPKRVTEVAMVFRDVPHLPFAPAQAHGLSPNALVLRIQPDEGIALRFGAKVPGQAFDVRTVSMDFSYGAAFLEDPPEAYERLLLDVLVGDPTLFIRTDEVEQAWRVVQPMLDAWDDDPAVPAGYAAGTWGPAEADELIQGDGRRWRTP